MAIQFGHALFAFKAGTEKDYYYTMVNDSAYGYTTHNYVRNADPNPTTDARVATRQEMLALKTEYESRNKTAYSHGDDNYAKNQPLNLWIEFNKNAMTAEEFEAARNGADQDITQYRYKWRCWWGRPFASMEKAEPWLTEPDPAETEDDD